MPSGHWLTSDEQKAILEAARKGSSNYTIAIEFGLSTWGVRNFLRRERQRRERKKIKEGMSEAEAMRQVQKEIYGTDAIVETITRE
jgi:hypothetical protein